MAKKFDIITVGSNTVDMFIDTGSDLFRKGKKKGIVEVPFGSKIIAKDVHLDVGGGGTNTAVAFARLGFKTAYIGKIGDDANGKHILKTLRRNKVDVSMVSKNKMKTGFSIILDAEGKDRTILMYLGANEELKKKDVKKTKLNTNWFYFSSMVGDSFKVLEELSDYAKNKKIKVMFNPSSYLAKKGIKHIKKILKVTDILIVNDKEAHLLTKKNGLQVMAKELYKEFKGIVVITLGERGAIAYDGEQFHTIKSNKVNVIETTGAGDAFASGFLAGMIKKNNIDFALKAGRAQAESVITHFGSKNKLLSWRQLLKLIGS